MSQSHMSQITILVKCVEKTRNDMARLAPPNSEERPRFSPLGGTQDMTIINESGLRLSDSIIEAASEKTS